jgi:uncharacterized protein (DUF2141 family)
MKKRLFYSIIAVLLCSCARQVGPGGGPDDITPPQVKATQPPIGSAGVKIHDKIVLTFSEWLDKKTVQAAITIFPEPQQGIRVSASGHTITITPVTAFSDSTTYHIEIGKSLKDLHNNSVIIPYQYYFSTGTTVDSGAVFGCIAMPHGSPVTQLKAALFAVEQSGLSDSSYHKTPNYVAQTDSIGNFNFNHIRKGRYGLVGFFDINNDNRIQPGIESVFASLDRTILIDSIVGPISLYASTYDTAVNRIVTVKPVSSHAIAGNWLSACDSLKKTELGMWRLEQCDSNAAVLRISRYIPIADGHRFVLFLTDTLSTGIYRLVYPNYARADTGTIVFDTLKFSCIGAIDTLPPLLVSMLPQGQSDLMPLIKIIWTRPVVSRVSSMSLIDSLGDTIQLKMPQSFTDTMVPELPRKLKPSRLYRLAISGLHIEDVNGRHPADRQYGFTTISSEDMCNSLAGSMPCLSSDPSRMWLFVPLNSDVRYVSKKRGTSFLFDSLPAGKGTLAYFSDYNGDGKHTPGSLVPWRKPEPYRSVSDTIEARARWDIEGIELKPCSECAQSTSANTQPAAIQAKETIPAGTAPRTKP